MNQNESKWIISICWVESNDWFFFLFHLDMNRKWTGNVSARESHECHFDTSNESLTRRIGRRWFPKSCWIDPFRCCCCCCCCCCFGFHVFRLQSNNPTPKPKKRNQKEKENGNVERVESELSAFLGGFRLLGCHFHWRHCHVFFDCPSSDANDAVMGSRRQGLCASFVFLSLFSTFIHWRHRLTSDGGAAVATFRQWAPWNVAIGGRLWPWRRASPLQQSSFSTCPVCGDIERWGASGRCWLRRAPKIPNWRTTSRRQNQRLIDG